MSESTSKKDSLSCEINVLSCFLLLPSSLLSRFLPSGPLTLQGECSWISSDLCVRDPSAGTRPGLKDSGSRSSVIGVFSPVSLSTWVLICNVSQGDTLFLGSEEKKII